MWNIQRVEWPALQLSRRPEAGQITISFRKILFQQKENTDLEGVPLH